MKVRPTNSGVEHICRHCYRYYVTAGKPCYGCGKLAPPTSATLQSERAPVYEAALLGLLRDHTPSPLAATRLDQWADEKRKAMNEPAFIKLLLHACWKGLNGERWPWDYR